MKIKKFFVAMTIQMTSRTNETVTYSNTWHSVITDPQNRYDAAKTQAIREIHSKSVLLNPLTNIDPVVISYYSEPLES